MMRIKSNKGLIDSDAKWLEAAKEVKMSDYKFDIDDKVRIRSAQIDSVGVIKSLHNKDSFGMLEYCVDFNGMTL